jgi:putative DNA primase/helicase
MTVLPPDEEENTAPNSDDTDVGHAGAQDDVLTILREAAPGLGWLRTEMWRHGFRPVAIENPVVGDPKTGKAPVTKDWPARARRNPPEAAMARVSLAALNTGLLCDGLRAVDIDVDDPELAARIETLAVHWLGATITRYRDNSPRRLLIYRTAEGEPGKRTLKGSPGKIEVLGRGQQAVVIGVHASGAWLQWRYECGPWNTPRDTLPAVSEEEISAFLAECRAVLGTIEDDPAGGRGLARSGTPAPTVAGAQGELGDLGQGPPPYSPHLAAELSAALALIPSKERGDWLHVGMALHSLSVAEGWGDWPRKTWDEWSRTCPEKFREEGQDQTWASFKPMAPGAGIGHRTIFHFAQEHGWNGPTWDYSPGTASAAAPDAAPAPPPPRTPDTAPGGHPRLSETDIANGRRLISMHGADLHYAPEWGTWVIWDARRGVWARDSTEEIVRRAKSVAPAIMAETVTLDGNDRQTRARWARESAMDAKINAMIRQARAEPGVTISATAFDSDPWLLGVQNGVIDLRRRTCGAFRPGRREDMVTKRAGAAYDPDAACPNWLEFLNIIFAGDAAVIAYVQRMCGYMLTGDVTEEALFLMYGTGQNGKSTFRETVHELLGDYASVGQATLLVETIKQRGATPELADLLGRRMVSINETGEGDRLAEGRIKAITSTDTITARDLYAKTINYRPTHKLLVTTNHRPVVRGADDGIWRRIHSIPFTVKIEQRDLDFRERCLVPELPGILNWALEGLRKWHARRLDPPRQLRDVAKGYRQDMDTVAQFLDEQCITGAAKWISRPALYRAYVAWAPAASGRPMSAPAFYERVKGREGVQLVKNNEWGFKGLALRQGDGTPFPTKPR